MIAHADYPSAEYGWHKPVDAQRVLWDRDRLMGFMVGKGQGISGADHFWFGHTLWTNATILTICTTLIRGSIRGFLTLAQLR